MMPCLGGSKTTHKQARSMALMCLSTRRKGISQLIWCLDKAVSKKRNRDRPPLDTCMQAILCRPLRFVLSPFITAHCFITDHLPLSLYIPTDTHRLFPQPSPASRHHHQPPLHLSSSHSYDVCLLHHQQHHQYQKEETQPPPNPRQTRVGICGGGHPHPTQVPGGLAGCLALHRAA